MLYKRHCTNKLMTIVSDCSYSGQWVRECAKTLDSLGIPPCGHRARENGALVKVFASCQPNEAAVEPCYSVEAVRVEDDGVVACTSKQLSQQRSMWFDSTVLVCCRTPDTPCPHVAFRHLKWEDGVDRTTTIRWIKREEEGRGVVWHYVMLDRAGDEYRQEFNSQFAKNSTFRLSDWGYVLESGEGEDIPATVREKIANCKLDCSGTHVVRPTMYIDLCLLILHPV